MAGRSLNKAQILGHAGKDAELRYTNNGKAVATFSVATSESWRDQSGTTQERTTWHNIVAWDKLAEVCGNYVKKGKQLYIEGRIQNRSYDDKDGNKKYISEIVVTDMILLGGTGDRSANGGGYSQSTPAEAHSAPVPEPSFDQAVPDSDLPF
ncbi:MAG TPA: single-stranded DNA-binding protein [Candidatus Kapabacteria bacterium]|nr:single-stranded DNA-binding protein [Candidatus Kapabacteria bacterium]